MPSLFSRIHWRQLSAFPWHSLLIALYAPLGLGAHNIGQTSAGSIARAVILSGMFAALLLFVCWLFLRNWQVAGVVASLCLILFLTYGHLYNYISDLEVAGFLVGRHRYLVMLWLALALLGSWWALRKAGRYSSLTSTLNLMSLFLVAMPVAQLLFYLQGDHGPSHFDPVTRMGILNAYYFPETELELYPHVTPVNTFRLLFNTYFGEDLNLLEDVSYYSEYPEAYQFEIIPNPCQGNSE